MSDLVTGEAVPLELRLAKMPSRALAFAIDFVIIVIAIILVLVLLGQLLTDVDAAANAAISLIAVVLVIVGIPTTIETLTRGKSVGKLALGLRVVRDDGGPIRFRHALARALAGVFADFYVTSGAGAIITSILNERGKRIGDLLAGTVVVRERVPASIAPLPQVPDYLAHWASGADIAQLPDGLSVAARNYLARARELSPQIRDSMGVQLAHDTSAYVSPPPPPGTPAWAYLAAVLGERHRRELMRQSNAAHYRAQQQPIPQPSTHRSRPAGDRSGGPADDASGTLATPQPAPPPSPEPRNDRSNSGGFAPPA